MMGKWSPYDEAWEKQRLTKSLRQAMEDGQKKRTAYEMKPRPVQRLIDTAQTVSYYFTIVRIWIRKHADRQYCRTMEAGVKQFQQMVFPIAEDT